MRSHDVIVIGAGVAGLRAAVTLASHGARVAVLEAKAMLGGRAATFTDPHTGEAVDNGQHVMLGCYRETFDFLRQIGTADRVRLQPNLQVDFVDREMRRSRLRLPSLPPPLDLAAGLFEWDALSWRDCIAAARLIGPLRIARAELNAQAARRRNGRIAASPGETVEEWLVHNGQTARIREMLWEPLALAALNQSIREAAAPPFVSVLARMFGGEPRDASLALPDCPLDELYAKPAREYIEARGGEVRIGCPATIHLAGGAVSFVEARRERLTAPVVVAAVAWHALPDLFVGETAPVDAQRAAAAATRASPIVSVNFWLDRQIMDIPFLGLPGRKLQWVFDTGQVIGGGSHIALVSSGAGEVMSMTNEDLISYALHELREALPHARAAKLTRASVVRERRASFSLAPGQPKRPQTTTAIPGLVLAGDWVETGLPATIEGAALSGRLAAEAVS